MDTKKLTKEYSVFSIENKKSPNDTIYAMKQFFKYGAKHFYLVESAYYGRVMGLVHTVGLTVEKKSTFLSDNATFFGMIKLSPYSDTKVNELLGKISVAPTPAPVVEEEDIDMEDESEMQVSDISNTDNIEDMQQDLNSVEVNTFDTALMDKLNGMKTKELKREYGSLVDIKPIDSKTIIINKIIEYMKSEKTSS